MTIIGIIALVTGILMFLVPVFIGMAVDAIELEWQAWYFILAIALVVIGVLLILIGTLVL